MLLIEDVRETHYIIVLHHRLSIKTLLPPKKFTVENILGTITINKNAC